MAWLVSENAPEMTACDAMTVAAVARPTMGYSRASGTSMKKGFLTATGLSKIRAPCPR